MFGQHDKELRQVPQQHDRGDCLKLGSRYVELV